MLADILKCIALIVVVLALFTDVFESIAHRIAYGKTKDKEEE